MNRRLASVLAGAGIACLLWAGSATAAVGDLSPKECFGNPKKRVAGKSCKRIAGLDDPLGLAVSPDGKDVYAASWESDALALFARRANGKLTRARCIGDTTEGDADCERTTDGLVRARAVAVSPDGKNVYVTGESALVVFARGPDGALTPAGCIANLGFREDENGPASCYGTIFGLYGAASVAVSPDGRYVYVAGSDYHAMVVLARAADGSLTPTQCLTLNAYAAGEFGCDLVDGLDTPVSLAVSPDGQDLYVAADDGAALVGFAQEADGSITPAGCVANAPGGPSSCYGRARGMSYPRGVAVSSDGENVYVATYTTVSFARGADGALSSMGCIGGTGRLVAPRVCERSPGFGGGEAIAVSPSGRNVYVAAEKLGVLKRRSNGALSPLGTSSPAYAAAVAISPDGRSVYVVDDNIFADDVLYVFERATKRRR